MAEQREAIKLVWDDLSPTWHEGVCHMAYVNRSESLKPWAEIEPWLREVFDAALVHVSRGNVCLL